MTFKQGQSGNPNGRPKGVIDKRIRLRELLEPHAAALIARAVELALAGDVSALRLCLERLIPKMRHETFSLALDNNDMSNTEATMMAGAATLQAVIDGVIAPEQGNAFSTMLENQRKAIQMVDLSQQIEEISKILKQRGSNNE